MASKPPPLRRTAQKDNAAPPTEEAVQSASQPARLDEASFEPAIPPAADPAPLEEDLLVGAEEDLEEGLVEAEEHSRLMKLFYGFGSCGISLIIHLVGLVLLAYLTMPTHVRNVPAFVEAMFDPRNEDDPVEFELDTEIQISTEMTAASISTSAMTGVTVGVQGTVGIPQLDQQVLKEAAAAAEVGQISIDHPLAGAPGFTQLIAAVPDKEFKGDPRAIIDNYEQAMDRIAQELMWMMEKGPVLVIWVFDQSGSMKDDQQEIRERLNNVYLQLGLVGRNQAQFLETGIVSFGEGYMQHTRRPTSDINEIRAAIDEIPEDKSGKEYMCQAVGRAISTHRDYARRTNRRMALILVSDESGEHDDNLQYLEPTVNEAKAADCRIYVLGREAVFGYPYAHIRWRHPQTNQMHWLSINRGPETGFVEQLQIDGFRRRHDAFSSGFGSYEQTRLARETGGVFFMLPSVESNLVRGEKRKYELDIMRPYRPDLRKREEVLADRKKYPLRTMIWQCIYDLNPYQGPEIARQIEMRIHFSLQYNEFVQQARIEQVKARNYLIYLARVQKALEDAIQHRQQEADPRWQANFDLIYGQVIAYQARIWEYGAACEEFIRNPRTAPSTKSPNLVLQNWNVTTREKTLTEDSKPYIERAKALFDKVIESHPGTPWAQRANWERKRGFGVDFYPDYDMPIITPPGGVTVPVPKL
jgi:hypothetical protein